MYSRSTVKLRCRVMASDQRPNARSLTSLYALNLSVNNGHYHRCSSRASVIAPYFSCRSAHLDSIEVPHILGRNLLGRSFATLFEKFGHGHISRHKPAAAAEKLIRHARSRHHDQERAYRGSNSHSRRLRDSSYGEGERPWRSAGLAPQAHTVFPRPRRVTSSRSRPPPTIVRRHVIVPLAGTQHT
jgi:hypothetical protein